MTQAGSEMMYPPAVFSVAATLGAVLACRLSNLCQALAAAAASLTSVAIVPGRRKGSHWQVGGALRHVV